MTDGASVWMIAVAKRPCALASFIQQGRRQVACRVKQVGTNRDDRVVRADRLTTVAAFGPARHLVRHGVNVAQLPVRVRHGSSESTAIERR